MPGFSQRKKSEALSRGRSTAEPKTDSVSRFTELARTLIEERFTTRPELSICERNISSLAGLLKKRGYNFFNSFLSATQRIAEGNPMLMMGIFSKQTVEEIAEFSIDGLESWVENCPGIRTDERRMFRQGDVEHRYRYVTLTKEYSDVDIYKAGTAKVKLEEVQDALNMFSMMIFNKYLLIQESPLDLAHTSGEDNYVFLPRVMADFETKEENKMAYYISTAHETSHRYFGSFVVHIEELLSRLRKEGFDIQIKKKYGKRILILNLEGKIQEFGKSDFHRIMNMLPDIGAIRGIANALEDMRVDSRAYDEKTGGYRKAFQKFHRVLMEKIMAKDEKEGKSMQSIISIYVVTAFLSLASDKEAAYRALFPRWRDRLRKTEFQGNENEMVILQICKGLPKKDLKILRKFRKRIYALAISKDDHSTESWKLALDMKEAIKKREKKKKDEQQRGQEGMQWGPGTGFPSGNIIAWDFQPTSRPVELESVEMKFGNQGEENGEEGEGLPGGGAALGVDMEKSPPVEVVRLEKRDDIEVDSGLVAEVKKTLTEIRSTRRVIRVGALHGRADPRAKAHWKRERRRGICKPRDHHLQDSKRVVRDVAILSIGDASGSTGGRHNEIIVGANNAMAEAVNSIAGMGFAYGFFNRGGYSNGTTFYEGMNFQDELRRTTVYSGGYNIDHEIVSFGGEMLRKETAKVRILVLTLDSMTGGGSSYMSGIDMVRDELNKVKGMGILTHVMSVPPGDYYYQSSGFGSIQEYFDYIYGPGDHYLLRSMEDLPRAWLRFIQMKGPLFKNK